MDDDTLRRKLILQHAGELVLSAVGSGLFCYLVWRALSEVSKYGYVTLNAGSRFGSGVIPAKLSFADSPYALVGILLVLIACSLLVARMIVGPAYHLLRLCLPRLGLPRVVRSRIAEVLSGFHFGVGIGVAALGVILIFIQYGALWFS